MNEEPPPISAKDLKTDHLDRCRFCLRIFRESNVFYKINEVDRAHFLTLTNQNLLLDNFSTISCGACKTQLKKSFLFRNELISNQEILNNLVFGDQEIEILLEILDEDLNDVVVDDEIQQQESLEDKINMKTHIAMTSGNELLPRNFQEDAIEDAAESEQTEDEFESSTKSRETEQHQVITSDAIEDSQYMEVYYFLSEDEHLDENLEDVEYDEEEIVQIIDASLNASHEDIDLKGTTQAVSLKSRRPQAWNWTKEMEVNLIRYRMKLKETKMSDNAVYTKISSIFAAKGYPKISHKSIRYKCEKLLSEPEKMRNMMDQACVLDDSDIEKYCEDKHKEKEKPNKTKNEFCRVSWNEKMEVTMLSLITKIKRQQPGISDHSLYAILKDLMHGKGYNVTKDSMIYRLKQLKKNDEKFQGIMEKVKDLETDDSSWKVDEDEENFNDDSINRSLQVVSEKRNYLHWTEEMKEALLKHRKNLVGRRTVSGKLWETVARRMCKDGYGSFTADNVMHKYFNIKRGTKKPPKKDLELLMKIELKKE